MSLGRRRSATHLEREDARSADEARRRAEASAASERRIAERFARLHAATAALSAALTPAEVAGVIAARGAALPGAAGCAVGVLRGGDTLEVTAARGSSGRSCGCLAVLPLSSDLPLAVAARERRPLFETGAPAGCAALVAVRCAVPVNPEGAVAALPLETAGEGLGAVAVAFATAPSFDEEERAFLQAFAHSSALALERARLYAAEREARLEAQRSAEAARTAVELQERLVAVVGHDLRTPLSAIRMSVEVLSRGERSPGQARTLARIGASAARMARIIHDLLDFTRVRSEGTIPVALRQTDLVDVCQRAVAELQAVHPDREIGLGLPGEAWLTCDPDRVAQIVSNLVGNALQHSPPGAAGRVSVAPAADDLVLVVHNEGPPIPPELTEEIFQPFRRGPHGGDAGSVGLGLFIVRELVRAHGGTVAVRSSAAEGTTFTVRLPRTPPAHGASTGRPAAEVETRPPEG